MKFLTRELVADLLNSEMPELFDTHDVERRVLRKIPIEFVKELYGYEGKNDPLRQFSMEFAKWIDDVFSPFIQQTGKDTTENLGGKRSECQQWRKISSGPIS